MPAAVTFTTAEILALAYKASLAGERALAGLCYTFANRPGPRTDYLIRTAAADLLTEDTK